MSQHEKRQAKLRQIIRRQKVDALLVTSFTNVTYLTGFTGDDSYLIVTGDDALLVTDPRYTTQLEEECPGLALRVRDPGEKMLPTTAASLAGLGAERVGVEADALTVAARDKLKNEAPSLQLEAFSGMVESLRVIKDRGEIDAIRHAAKVAVRAFNVLRAIWWDDASEADLARELEYHARKFGAKCLSFPPILAAGPRAALPHASPTSARVGDHAFTLVDWGVYAPQYASDLTRMVIHGKPTKKFEKVYQVVLEAQQAGIGAIRPGAKCEDVDKAARDVIAKAGFGPRFGHGLGHGLGLQVHEGPRLGRQQETELRPGMVVTVEPGIYLPGVLGVRLEDDVLVTKSGSELLSDAPKSFEESFI